MKCQLCDTVKNISQISIPYNFKLLIQELMSIGVKTTLTLEHNKYNNTLSYTI